MILKLGSTGLDVINLQKALNISSDGVFGPLTEAAVKAYQSSHQLVADGVVGPLTAAALGLVPSPQPRPNPSGYLKGVDTSHYELSFDFARAVLDGIVFMMTKASEGRSMVDSAAGDLIAAAGAAGIKFRGLYHFFHAGVNVTTQVNLFLKMYNSIKTEFAPILDLEESSVDGLPASVVREAALAWLEAVESATGRTPILYIDENMLQTLSLDARFAKYVPWIAAYNSHPPTFLGPWQAWSFWQFTDAGEQHADTDYFAGDMAALQALAGT